MISRLSSWDIERELKLPAFQKREGRIKNEEVPQQNEKEKGREGAQQELADGKEYLF